MEGKVERVSSESRSISEGEKAYDEESEGLLCKFDETYHIVDA